KAAAGHAGGRSTRTMPYLVRVDQVLDGKAGQGARTVRHTTGKPSGRRLSRPTSDWPPSVNRGKGFEAGSPPGQVVLQALDGVRHTQPVSGGVADLLLGD